MSNNVKARTIFYAWQSDLPNATNRSFIRAAIDAALKEINTDIEPFDAVRADQDTQGVAGSPSIAETIFSKIDDCAVFVADISTVTNPGTGRPMPNPNVLIEYGRASKKGDEYLIQVFNEAFGKWEHDRPFDLRHKRKPICYRLPKNYTPEGRQSALRGLSRDLTAAIRSTLDATPATALRLPEWATLERFESDYAALTIPEWQDGRQLLGFWVGAIPLGDTIDLERVSARPELMVERSGLKVIPGTDWETLDRAGEISHPHREPFLGGLHGTNKCGFIWQRRGFADWTYQHAIGRISIRNDGSIFIGTKWSNKVFQQHLNMRWIVADVANTLRVIAKIRESLQRPNIKYALAIELRNDEQDKDSADSVSSGDWRLCYVEDENGTIGPPMKTSPVRFGPYFVKSSDSFGKLLRDVFTDMYELTGRRPNTEYSFTL